MAPAKVVMTALIQRLQTARLRFGGATIERRPNGIYVRELDAETWDALCDELKAIETELRDQKIPLAPSEALFADVVFGIAGAPDMKAHAPSVYWLRLLVERLWGELPSYAAYGEAVANLRDSLRDVLQWTGVVSHDSTEAHASYQRARSLLSGTPTLPT